MKKLHWLFIFFPPFLLACSGKNQAILIMASGTVKVSGQTITLEPGSRHNEEKVSMDNGTFKVESPAGIQEYKMEEGNGLYILNLKQDTLVGSYQRIGEAGGSETITLEDLKQRIDSLQQLTKGTNTSTTKRNFFIPPNKMVRISGNKNSEVVGPYLKMPESFDAGKEHEVYKFYTNKEMYEIIGKLKPMVGDSIKTN